MRALRSPPAGAALLLAGCTTGDDAVDVNNGGEFRFVAGTPARRGDPGGRARHGAGVLRHAARRRGVRLVRARGRRRRDQLLGILVCALPGGDAGVQRGVADVADDGVQFLGVNVKEPSEQFALAFVDRFGIAFPSLYDPRGEVALAFRDYPANADPVHDRAGPPRAGSPPCTPVRWPRRTCAGCSTGVLEEG